MFRLSFTIGPVQGFVAQARRTKDFWAGSWLLSYLAEVAIVAGEANAERVLIPYRDAQSDKGVLNSLRHVVGGVPNRMEMRFHDQATARQAATTAAQSLRDEWLAIAGVVWERYLQPIAQNGNGTEDIWRRQTENFWEVSWVVTDEQDPNQLVGAALQGRKAFRNVPATTEPGTKCSLMSDYQELSGFVGVANRGHTDAFWQAYRDQLPDHEGLDLGKDERLCAMALIKRMLPNVISKLPVHPSLAAAKPTPRTDDDNLTTQSRWPSLGFFASLDWLKSLKEPADAVKHYIADAQQSENSGEPRQGRFWASEIEPAKRFEIPWATVDATAWFKTGVVNRRQDAGLSDEKRQRLQSQLGDIYKAHGQPIPYYAMLFMDGDSMGKLLSELGDSTDLSRRLSQFSAGVDKIVHANCGRTVYAGGDDVLAFLTADKALAAADQLQAFYRKCFDHLPQATLSGAILYVQWRFPLSKVIRLAHQLLDEVAKEATGRDALAIAIVQGSGLNAIWSAPWKVVLGDRASCGDAVVPLKQMVDRFSSDSGIDDESEALNASYLYRLRQQFAPLFPRNHSVPGSFQQLAGDDSANLAPTDTLLELAHSEFRRRMTRQQRETIDHTQTRPQIEQLMTFTQAWQRDDSMNVVCNRSKFTFDGWRVARFLKQVRDGNLPDHE